MVDVHDRERRNFGIDQVFGLVGASVAIPTAFYGFVDEWI